MRHAFFKKLEQHVGGLFEAVRTAANLTGERFGRTPYTDELFAVQGESLLPYEQTVCRAVATREAFREHAPHWAPELPLSPAEWEKMIRSKDSKIAVVGYFGRSVACANWTSHLAFYDYVCGLMACEFTPPCIRAYVELQLKFAPKPIAGFDRSLCWGVDKRIFEFTQQLMKTEKIWRYCGMTDDAKWIRSVIERIGRIELDQKLRDFLDSQPPR